MSGQPTITISENDIAIIGMAAHVPGAGHIEEFWRNLRDGVEAVRPFTDAELLTVGVSPPTLADPGYVKSGAVLEDMEFFDAEFFGFSPKEAAIMDPQHRHFLECSWEALENAGHPPESFPGSIGVFAGCGMGAYFMFNLLTNPHLVESVGLFLLRHTGNDKDFLSTRVSYLFNLTGPSVSVQTACSTSLVAAHMACQSLLSGECDLALAGGVTIEIPHYRGYLYQENEILSPDGHCRAFDHRSKGTIFGSGAGVVVLRRLGEAMEDGDHIYAVIKGSAVNNDGAGKVGYLAPSVDGQAAAIAEALAVAGVSADSIGMVECHGTGTPVGDPIEISALSQAFRQTSKRTGFCGVGSVKSNIGHLDTAAGVASLMKAALALYHKQLPPSLNYEAPNPTIEFRGSPFYVIDHPKPWSRGAEPRRAGVNSLGVGGTNAFTIVEEPPPRAASTKSSRPYQLLMLSARNRAAVDASCQRLAAHLRDHADVELADAAYSLAVGRRAFDVRRVLACRDREEAIGLLESLDTRRVFTHKVGTGKPSVVYMYPGGGAQYPRMGLELYETEPIYREVIDRGLTWLGVKVEFDYRRALFPTDPQWDDSVRELQRPSVQLPLIFLVELALSKLWMSWEVKPEALIGHSLGENTAACIAGVLSFEDALGLVTLRGQLFEKVTPGGMLSVPLPADELKPLLGDELDLATINSPGFCVASGKSAALDALEKRLLERGVEAKRIPISIAAHSRLVEPILNDFGVFLRSIPLKPPQMPFLSNLTGAWITPQQATDPEYWVQHLRHTVRFADGIGTLLKTPGRVFLEVGPGKTLGSLVRQHPDMKQGQPVLPSLRHPEEKVPDAAFFLTALGQAWAAGVPFEKSGLWKNERRLRIPLPTYAFQRQKYWIEPGKATHQPAEAPLDLTKRPDLRDWCYRPVWKQQPAPPMEETKERPIWLVFVDEVGVGRRLIERLRKRGHEVIAVREGDAYFKASPAEYVLSPEHGREGYDALIRDLVNSGKVPNRFVHLWLLTADESFRPGSSFFHRNQERGFYSLFFLAQALGAEGVSGPRHLAVVSNGMQRVGEEPLPYADKATVVGPVKVIPREFPGYTCTSIDVVLPELKSRGVRHRNGSSHDLDAIVEMLEGDVLAAATNDVLAHREGRRWKQGFERGPLDPAGDGLKSRIREKGVYLITGGLGGIGGVLAEFLAKTAHARLVLVGRSDVPPREEWDALEARAIGNGVARKLRKIRELESLGAEVMLVSADVTDIETMGEVVTAARRRFGAIHGVIHAAGVLNDGLIQVKTQADIEEVFTPKVHGTLVLDTVLRDIDLDFMVLFSSSSTVTAPAGQVDYVAANEFLNAYAAGRATRGRRLTVAINWGVWNGVGMAAEAAARMERGSSGEAPAEQPTNHPLFTSKSSDGRGTTVLNARYSPRTHWVFDEHRTASGHSLMPGTAFLELARGALAECGERGSFEIRDLFFFRPLAVGDDEIRDARVRLRQDEAGYVFEVQSKRVLGDGRFGWESHAQAKLLLRALPTPNAVALSTIRQRCSRRTTLDETGLRSRQEEHLRFGSRWRVWKEAHYGEGEALARIELPAALVRDLDEYALHPAMLDYATGFALDSLSAYGKADTLWVPVSYKSTRIHGPFGPRLWSWIRVRSEDRPDNEFALFDVVICDEDGNVVVEVDEFAMKRLTNEALFGGADNPSATELEMETATGNARGSLSPAELAFRHNLQNGILPAEGAEAFTRILCNSPGSQVVVSSMDLHALVRQADAAASESKISETKFERPALDSEYVEPRDDIEKTLVGFWEGLLGVDRVGIRDSFFDLGGHSLIAVRLFAKIKKSYQVEYPISVLFNAPTIEQCAAMIREQVGAVAAKQESAAPPQRTRYKHLVPMHRGDGRTGRPFFLVAGMFGNVLNLRHLAHLIGVERPFYGIQARGLYGDDLPHETFEEMAADYLTEIRAVQPQGPYLLAGFSGGGIAAFEMTRQLREAGEEVALLVLLDTPLPHSPPLTRRDKALIHWQKLTREGPAYLTDWARRRASWELRRFRGDNGAVEGELSPAEFRSEAIKDAFYRALPKYLVRFHPGRMALFRPMLDEAHVLGPGRVVNRTRDFVYHDNGWEPYVHRVDVYEVPGDHDSMVLEPNVRVVAQKLKKCLLQAESKPRKPVTI